jgi:plasmid rolling circle replication initiator protein Rep
MSQIIPNNAPRTSLQWKKTDGQGLADYSPKDRPWDVHRGQADDVGRIYSAWAEFERLAARMVECAGFLRFAMVVASGTGELALMLREAFFCRVRHCPVCQWRRSLMWQARFYQALPAISAAHPKARWIFLTLTVRNCPITELGAALTDMNAAWKRLCLRSEFKPVLGWVRTTEVTRGQDGTAHPHFHALLMVSPSYFGGKSYVTQLRWTELWAECLRVDYIPLVDVRAVRPNARTAGKTQVDSMGQGLQGAISETLKYSVKPEDMTGDPDWFLEMTRQVHKRRFVATGGVLKDVLKVDEETNSDMVMADGPADSEDDGTRLAFAWTLNQRRYRRALKLDVGAKQ